MDKLLLVAALAWRNLWRNPRRTVITMLVVGVGLWSVLVFAMLSTAWSQSSRDTTVKLMTGEGQIHAAGYLDNPTVNHRMAPPNGQLLAVLQSDAVSAYARRVRVSAIVQSEYKTLPVTLAGVVADEERALSVLPEQVATGRYLNGPNDDGIVLGRKMLKRLKTRIGKRVVVMVQGADGQLAERAFAVVGAFSAPQRLEDSFVFTGLTAAQSMTNMEEDLSEIAFDATDSETLPDLLNKLKAAAPKLDVQSWQTLEPLAYATSTFLDSFIFVWLGFMFVLIAIGIVNTQLMAVFERVREFGLVQALGMHPRLVRLEVAFESALLIGIGTLCGIALAVAFASAFPNGLDLGFLGRGAELFGAGHIFYLKVDPARFTLYSVIIWVLGVIAALWPAWRASRVSPVTAMTRG